MRREVPLSIVARVRTGAFECSAERRKPDGSLLILDLPRGRAGGKVFENPFGDQAFVSFACFVGRSNCQSSQVRVGQDFREKFKKVLTRFLLIR